MNRLRSALHLGASSLLRLVERSSRCLLHPGGCDIRLRCRLCECVRDSADDHLGHGVQRLSDQERSGAERTSDEHRDFEMLERNYAAVGGTLDEIRSGRKNIGSEAFSAYMLHMASQENPFALIGAMFIVEGLGNRIARQWGERIQRQLNLENDAVSFFMYHAQSDVQHFRRLDLAIGAGVLTEKLVPEIVKCAKVTARLYALQLEEMGHF